jgi:hypothetical protein
MDFLYLLWTILSFVLGLLWQVAWFLLRDLISAVLWLLVLAWALMSVRYRSFSQGALALVRFGRYGLRHLWRWLRGQPVPLPAPPPPTPKPRRTATVIRYRKPFGTVSISEELNVLLLAGTIFLLFLA